MTVYMMKSYEKCSEIDVFIFTKDIYTLSVNIMNTLELLMNATCDGSDLKSFCKLYFRNRYVREKASNL